MKTPGLVLLMSVAFLAGPDAAAEDTIYLPERSDEISALRLRSVDGWTEALFRARRESAAGFEIRETLVSPRLHLGARGSVYHHELLAFRLGGSVRLDRFRVSGDETRSEDLTFGDYDASVRILDHKALNMSLFARDDEAWIDSAFRGSYRIRSWSHGGELRIENGFVPLQLSYHRDRRREDLTDVERVEERERVRVSAAHRSGASSTDASFRFVDTQQTFQPQSYETVTAALSNTLRFVPDSPTRLRSSVSYFNQYGTLRRRDLSLAEDARVHWTESLESVGQYRFTEQTGTSGGGAGGERQLIRSHRADLGGRHTLWGSLTTALNLYASSQDVYDRVSSDRTMIGEDRLRGGRADLTYVRTTPIGRLRLGFGWERARDEQSSQDRTREVRNESHVLQDGNEPFLDQSSADASTIVVTDPTGFVVYQEGIDYTVSQVGSRTVLFRVPSGSIADGQAVAVDYRFEFSPELAYDIRGKSVQLRMDTERDVSVYYRYDRTEEDFVSGIANGFLEDQRNHLVGLRYQRRGFSATEEYEVRRLLESEFRTNRVAATLSRRMGRSRLSLTGTHARSRFEERDHVQSIYSLSARAGTSLPSGVTIEGEAWARFDRGAPDAQIPSSDLLGVRLQVTKQYRAIAISTGAFYRDTDRNDIDDDRMSFFASVRRAFRIRGGGR